MKKKDSYFFLSYYKKERVFNEIASQKLHNVKKKPKKILQHWNLLHKTVPVPRA